MVGKTALKRSSKRILSNDPVTSHGLKEYLPICLISTAAFLLLCLISYDPRDPSFNVATTKSGITNLCGLFGSYIADAIVQLFGKAAFLIPTALIFFSVRLFTAPQIQTKLGDVCAFFFLIAFIGALIERITTWSFLRYPLHNSGGAIGGFLHSTLYMYFGSVGEILSTITFIGVLVLYLCKLPVKKSAQYAINFMRFELHPGQAFASIWARIPRRSDLIPRSVEHSDPINLVQTPPLMVNQGEMDVMQKTPVWEKVDLNTNSYKIVECDNLFTEEEAYDQTKNTLLIAESKEPPETSPDEKEPAVNYIPIKITVKKSQEQSETAPDMETQTLEDSAISSQPKVSQKSKNVIEHLESSLESAIDEYLNDQCSTIDQALNSSRLQLSPIEKSASTKTLQDQNIKVVPRADDPIQKTVNPNTILSNFKPYVLPSSDLLDVPPTSLHKIDEETLKQNAATLEQKLADLGVKGTVVEIHPGPVITMYEITLAPGIPLRRVTNMSDDLAMALKSGSTRVVAPIPGKDTVGIEVPNLQREIVFFREIIESRSFRESQALLKMALGKGIDGEPFSTSLTRMPHLLIAGATGTGKSVGLNCLICSWLMSCSPEDVKFLMVDPKKLELSYYQDIPHLLHPVVTEPEKVPKVLSWAIREMERRYDLLSLAGAKNIEGYNHMLAVGKLNLKQENPPIKLPYIIIIIDELAELMMVAAKDIEISIARLAQMARAAGIHLILATQRPSVDVITGVIKANFPARLSYQVSAKPDSRTILDTVGAENLLGMGDMLFLPPGTAKLRRLHGAYVSENEIRRIVDHIKVQRQPVYLQEITRHVADAESKMTGTDLIDDTKYDEAVELVTRLGHASISLIQRHMRIGYNRAARIIEAMESEGIIGPSDGTSRPREVLGRSLESVSDY
jgi:DNA segregation ATPase FtsK/SpoIIIE-like protein